MSHAQRGVVWDVGSHIGYFVLVALRLGCSLIAIEPNPSNVQRIRATLARNDLACTVLQIAAGPSFRTAKLAVEGDSSTGRISAHGVSVRTVPLDILLESHPAPALIKIDVEGFEAEVLRGADRLLNEIRPVFLIELHPWADETFVFEQLGAYDITTFDEHHLLAMPTSGPVHLTKHQPAF